LKNSWLACECNITLQKCPAHLWNSAAQVAFASFVRIG
jgi:hypothetical protein